MKKEFKPELIELTIAETSNSLSGPGVNTTPEPIPDPVPSVPIVPIVKNGCWTIRCEYANHNTGSHSEVKIIGDHTGDHTGNVVQMVVVARGVRIAAVPDSSGYRVSCVSETGFILERDNFYNPKDHFEFNIQVKFYKEDGSIGAIGTTGVHRPCDLMVVSWSEK